MSLPEKDKTDLVSRMWQVIIKNQSNSQIKRKIYLKSKNCGKWTNETLHGCPMKTSGLFFYSCKKVQSAPTPCNMVDWTLSVTYFLSIVSILANGFVIVVVSTKRKLHTTSNAFILSLAVADFCAGFYILPSTHAREHLSSNQSKRMFSSFQYFLFYTSSWNLCLVTADRYLALTRPLRYVTVFSRKRVCLLIFMAWCFPLVIYLLQLTWILSRSPQRRGIGDTVFVAVLLTSLEFLPCVVMVTAAVRLYYISHSHSRQTMFMLTQLRFNHPTLDVTGLKIHRDRDMASAKLITSMVGVFVFCYMMEMVSSFLVLLNIHRNFLTKQIRFMMLLANSTLNPLVYALLKRDIKSEFKRVLCRFRCRKRQRIIGISPQKGKIFL